MTIMIANKIRLNKYQIQYCSEWNNIECGNDII